MIDEIKIWLNSQHIWLQEAASRIIAGANITNTDILDFVEKIKTLSGKNKEAKLFPELKDINSKNIRLLSLGPIEGIDKLNPRKPLEFDPENLTVIYGQNGSGKSGIVRILKNICGKPHRETLKSDIYAPSPRKQSCVIKYNNGAVQETEWFVDTPPVGELAVVDIFDSKNGDIYLTSETEASYTPPELVLFEKLVDVCGEVKALLNDEQQKLVSKLPTIPDRYKTTSWASMYNTLKHDTPQSKIDELLLFSSDDEECLKSLRQRLSAVDPMESAKKQRAINEQLKLMRTAIGDCVNIVSANGLNDIRLKFDDAKQKRKNVIEGAKVLDSTTMLEGIGSDTWKKLWTAARDYSTVVYHNEVFPYIGENARCPLCQQKLDEETKSRLQRFEAFIQDKLESEAKIAERAMEDLIVNLPVCLDEARQKSICQAAGLDDDTVKEIAVFFSHIGIIFENIRKKQIPAVEAISIPDTDKLLAKLLRLEDNAEKNAIQFDEDVEAFDRDVENNKLLNIESKQWISEQKTAVETEVIRLKKVEQYEQWKKHTGTTGISREASNISEKLITEAYIVRFNQELKALGAISITVELVKTGVTKGRSKHEIRLKNATDDIRATEILSDGEKRIVSLAAFLADVTGRNASTPFIFDDPISSLDQEFEEKTIERLVELSKTRQVIVFTHRLSFFGIINDKAKQVINTIHICRTPWGTTGESDDFSVDIKKPDKAMNRLKQDHLTQARNAYNEKNMAAYKNAIAAICNDFRKLIERFVEIVLLSDVIQRHRRAVNTMGKIQNLAKIQKTDCDLIDEMMSKYSCFEHSQSDESPVSLPVLEEIEEDIDKMVNWHSEFTKRTI